MLAHDKPNYDRPEAFAVWASDEIRASKSSSGGVFPVLAKYFLDTGGVVCGAAFVSSGGDLPRLEHIIITSADELPRLQGSKYIQSDTSNVLEPIKKTLRSGQKVLFVGLPCQVAGLKQYLKKDYENLLTLDLICHGVPSYELWARYMKERFGDEQVLDQTFRDKDAGWSASAHMGTITTEKRQIKQLAWQDAYLRAFYNNLSLNNACFSCKFSTLPRIADITMGDFWGVREWREELDDIKGTSVILINNQKAGEYINKVKEQFILFEPAPLEVVPRANPNLIRPSIPHRNYGLFWRLLSQGYSVEKSVEICLDDKCDFAIYNFWYVGNYGASITAFALQRLLWDMGYSNKYVNLVFNDEWHSSFAGVFARKYLDLSAPYTKDGLKVAQYNFKSFLFGSDQVLRPEYHFDHRKYILEHFLGLNQRRLMISASYGQNAKTFGQNQIGRILRDYYNTFFASFDYISHREENGVEVTREYFGMDSEFVLDPVFLVDYKHYDEIIANNKVELPKKFGLFYLLYEKDEPLYQKAIAYLKEQYGIPIVLLKPSQNLSVDTFLALFKGCEFVLTDSFHGVCFSIIFGKNFYCIEDEARGGDRFASLKVLLGLEEHCLAKPDDIVGRDIKAIDFERINSIIATHRATSLERLKTALDGRNTNESAKFGKIAMSAMVASNIQIAQK